MTKTAVIRLCVEKKQNTEVSAFSVTIAPQTETGNFPKEVRGHIDEPLFKKFQATYPNPKGLDIATGSPEPALALPEMGKIKIHADALIQVFWGEEVWEESIKSRWSSLIKEMDHLIVELVVCKELRGFIWEACLSKLSDNNLKKVSIIRLIDNLPDEHKPVQNEQSQSHTLRKGQRWLFLFYGKNHIHDSHLEAIKRKLTEITNNFKKRNIPAELELGNTAQLEWLKTQLEIWEKQTNNNSLSILCFVGFGELPDNDLVERKPLLFMSDDQGRDDKVTWDRLRATLNTRPPDILLLVACWTATLPDAIVELLEHSRIIVALQGPISLSATLKFLNNFSEPLTEVDTLEDIARRIATHRTAMPPNSSTYFETSIPVIYSAYPVQAESSPHSQPSKQGHKPDAVNPQNASNPEAIRDRGKKIGYKLPLVLALGAVLILAALLGIFSTVFPGTLNGVIPEPTSVPTLVRPPYLPLSVQPCPGGMVDNDYLQPMPFYVFGSPDPAKNHFCPSGFMGDTGDIEPKFSDIAAFAYKFEGEGPSTCDPNQCKWAGVYWMNRGYKSDEDWASEPFMGYNLSNATRLLFCARSQDRARVEFKVGGIYVDPITNEKLRFPDSLTNPLGTGYVELTPEWKEFSIDLKGADLSYVIGGFLWAADWSHNSEKDEITFELKYAAYQGVDHEIGQDCE